MLMMRVIMLVAMRVDLSCMYVLMLMFLLRQQHSGKDHQRQCKEERD
jgi:hypothetical protein